MLSAATAHGQTKQIKHAIGKAARPYKIKGYVPEAGFVPDSVTAIRIAEAVWLPIYGNGIEQEKPFSARLRNGTVWVVNGFLPDGMRGGTAYIEINKQDGRVLYVMHSK